MKRKLFFLVLTAVVAVIVWSLFGRNRSEPLPNDLQEQLIRSASFEALSLDPVPVFDSDKIKTNSDKIFRYPVLGRVKIDDQNLRRELVVAISKDVAEANHPQFKCMLEPRHGVRCVDGSNTVLIAICYHCGDVVLARNGKNEDYLIKMNGVLLSPASKELFEKIFKEAGIKASPN